MSIMTNNKKIRRLSIRKCKTRKVLGGGSAKPEFGTGVTTGG